jgi:hypothetical protein
LDNSLAAWLVILLALFAANLPFFNDQLFGFIPVHTVPSGRKSLWWRLLELVALYFIVGGIARLLEANAGNAFNQTWEFYAITAFLFLVFAFPGFVFRYLVRQRT